MTDKEVLHGLLSKTLNMDENAVASLYNEDGSLKSDVLNVIESKDAERVLRIKTEASKEAFNDAHKKSKAEVFDKFEKDFTTKTGFKSDKKGLDLILSWGEEIQKNSQSQITDDLIKKHPIYLTMIESKEKEKNDLLTKVEQDFNQYKSDILRKETFSQVSNKALDYFNSLNPVLSSDPSKAKAQQELFVEKLANFNYELQGDRIVVMKDGKSLEDKHGNPVKFDSLVKDIAERYYDFHKGQHRQSPNGGSNNNGNNGKSFQIPKSEAEYAKVITDKTLSVEERQAIKEAYKAQAGN